ncbi:4'-phosphopantetheinyl transferase superfamily protein [Candidatus Gracilibacteria bacterium]|nr:4'-phosphopantetheinyl transferase superfamily protein [Candidatus Gracilibacteria bacterium]
MKLEVINNPSELLSEAENFFSASFYNNVKIEKPGTYTESLVARYFIEKNKNTYSCISHKENLVFVGTSENKIGVDIEILKKRDITLLDTFSDKEYEILGGKNWNNFYILWTAKESFIKHMNLTLENMSKISLTKSEPSNCVISGLEFSCTSILCYNKIEKTIYTGKNGNLLYSVCID